MKTMHSFIQKYTCNSVDVRATNPALSYTSGVLLFEFVNLT